MAKSKNKSKNWGGKREGAGGKQKIEGGGVTTAFVLSLDDLTFIDEWKDRSGVSRSEAVRQIIAAARSAGGKKR